MHENTSNIKQKNELIESIQVEEDQIDLREIYFALKKKILWLVAAGLFCGCIACLYAKVFITPTYVSTSSMLVLSKETTLTSMADLQLGTQLTNDYQELIKSTPVLEQVIENLGLSASAGGLKGSISISNPSGTRILYLSVTHTDPVLAKNIVDELVRVSSEYIGDTMEVIPPKVIEKGVIPTYKTGPDIKRYTLMGILIGIVICAGLVVVQVLLDDSIKSEDDITRYLGIPTLAVIPDRKDYIGAKQRKQQKTIAKKSGKGDK